MFFWQDREDDTEFARQFDLAKNHKLLPTYVKHIRDTEGLSEEDWSFGSEEPTEDVNGFIDWLKTRGLKLDDNDITENKPEELFHNELGDEDTTETKPEETVDEIDPTDVLGSAIKARAVKL